MGYRDWLTRCKQKWMNCTGLESIHDANKSTPWKGYWSLERSLCGLGVMGVWDQGLKHKALRNPLEPWHYLKHKTVLEEFKPGAACKLTTTVIKLISLRYWHQSPMKITDKTDSPAPSQKQSLTAKWYVNFQVQRFISFSTAVHVMFSIPWKV